MAVLFVFQDKQLRDFHTSHIQKVLMEINNKHSHQSNSLKIKDYLK